MIALPKQLMARGDRLEPGKDGFAAMRLDKYLSEAGVASRKELRAMIKGGRVTVDGETAHAPDMRIDEGSARVKVDGAPVSLPGTVVLMLHKPAGYVTSTDDPRDPTVMELLPAEYRELFPVGRLDKETEGLLLFTNDGALCHALTSPRRQVEKEYYAETRGEVDDMDAAAFRAGMELRDGTKCLPAELRPGEHGCYVTVREGKYHQVRRMLAARGKPVEYLRREREGSLRLGSLPLGGTRLLTEEEVEALRREASPGPDPI